MTAICGQVDPGELPVSQYAIANCDVRQRVCRPNGGFTLRALYRNEISGKRVLLADDVRNTGQTFARCASLVQEAGGTVVATIEICDRCEPAVDLGLPNIALAEYHAPENYTVGECPLCNAGQPITRF